MGLGWGPDFLMCCGEIGSKNNEVGHKGPTNLVGVVGGMGCRQIGR